MEMNFGVFGGQYVDEKLKGRLNEIEKSFIEAVEDPKFMDEFNYYMKNFVGRESPLYFAENLSNKYGGRIYLKREDLNYTGSHKINNGIGQTLLAKKMGKNKVIAETGAGQHGVATATAAALFDMKCDVYMGIEDIKRQELNVFKMEALGAKVIPVTDGTGTLTEAVDKALEAFVLEEDSFYVLGSVVGPHPYPGIVRFFQSVISREAKKQIMNIEGRYPDYVIACLGGGSNAMGAFSEFIAEEDVKLIGVEAGGKGIKTGEHASALTDGRVGIMHGMKTYFRQDEEGNALNVHSISAGMDYPGIGPEHAYLKENKRAEYTSVNDDEAVEAFLELIKLEGIIPAIESSHAVAQVMKMNLNKDEIAIISLSGRGDKDVARIADLIK